MVTITLEAWEYEWAAHVGIRRLTANLHKRDAAHYDQRRMQDNVRAQIAGACCEIAVAKATNRYWSGSAWTADQHDKHKRAIADVGERIEVKRVREASRPVAVRRRDVDAGMYLYAAHAHEPDFTRVTVYGWLRAADAWSKGTPAQYDKTGQTRVVELGYLTPMTHGREAA